MQDRIRFNGYDIRQPDGYKPKIETTSTPASGRDQSLNMHNTPMGSIVAYELTWSNLNPYEMSEILQQVLNKSSFEAHYFDVYKGIWTDDLFYSTTYNIDGDSLEADFECWGSLSFQMTRVNAI